MSDGLLHWRPSPVLPDDAIFQILLRLPVRSLLQLKRVCKSWKTLISDPCFVKSHLSLTMSTSITHQHLFSSEISEYIKSFPVESLLENLSHPTKSVSFSMKHFFQILWSCNNGSFQDSLEPTKAVEFDSKSGFNIFGSCNGLLCIFDKYDGCVRLWNPSVRLKSKKSPSLYRYEYKNPMSTHYENPLITQRGFGYDHVHDKYKLLVHVTIFPINSSSYGATVTKIYTFGENISMKTIPNFCDRSGDWDGKFVSGTLNWVVKNRVFNSNQKEILSFDLEKEIDKILLLPEHDGVNVCNPRLCVSNNCLYVCFYENKTHLVLWLMKTYGVVESWTRLMTIPHEKLWNPVHHSLPFVEPVLILENHIVLVISNKLVFYNLNNGRVDSPRISGVNYVYRQYVYHESLVSPLL